MEEIKSVLNNLFERMEAQRILHSSFCEASITLAPKPDKNFTKKKLQNNISCEHKKVLNKILPNQTQQCIRRIIYHNQMGFITCMQRSFNIQISINVIFHINSLKKKNQVIM